MGDTATHARAARVHAVEIPYAEPAALFAPFAADPWGALLDGRGDDALARYSVAAVEPFGVLLAGDDAVTWNGRRLAEGPLQALRRRLEEYVIEPLPGLPPGQGGAVGLLGYELGRRLEDVPAASGRPAWVPDLALLFCDVVVCADRLERRAFVCSSGLPERDARTRAARARARARHVLGRLRAGPQAPPEPASPAERVEIVSDVTRAAYERAVADVIERILNGDVFQVNLSQRFTAPLPRGLTALDLHRRLAAGGAAPYAGLLRLGDASVVSASPERFLHVSGGRVDTRPIKGTRPRGSDPAADRRLARELEASVKDRAENVMIVDLLRNDLSRVCEDGTVEVPRLCALERTPTVMHLVSTVTGRLRPDRDLVDLVAACFPGGSVTGAPKIQAMRIIAELEPVRRGAYCGSLALVGFDGTLESSVAIRTMTVRRGRVAFPAGGGITAASEPAAEYEETLHKAAGLRAALLP
jgi:para-aminobenzoate synthetase component 1